MLDGKAPQGMEALAVLVDFSKMKFKDRDAVAEALRQLSLKVQSEARIRSYQPCPDKPVLSVSCTDVC